MNLTNRNVEAEYSRHGVKLFRYRYTAFKVIHWYGVKEIYHGKARYWRFVSPRAAVDKWLKLLEFWGKKTNVAVLWPTGPIKKATI